MDDFKKTIPLIGDLRNSAMHARHWAMLKEATGTDFDPNDAAFTLDSLVQLELSRHAELVAELSATASSESAVEHSIEVCKTTTTSGLG